MESAIGPGAALAQPPDPERWVEEHGDQLYRHALTRVGNAETAQDLVQETLLAACRSLESYAGRASERTWLLRILRNKIVDYYRRQRPVFATGDAEALAKLEANQFAQSGFHRGGWSTTAQPGHWQDAEQCLIRSEFWDVVQQCAGKLPQKFAVAFLMREVEDATSEEVCSVLNINRNHLGVLLHRARLAMRRCLELHWFREPPPSPKPTPS